MTEEYLNADVHLEADLAASMAVVATSALGAWHDLSAAPFPETYLAGAERHLASGLDHCMGLFPTSSWPLMAALAAVDFRLKKAC